MIALVIFFASLSAFTVTAAVGLGHAAAIAVGLAFGVIAGLVGSEA